MKNWFFKNYWWIIGIAALAGIAIVFRYGQGYRGQLVLGILGTALSGIYFVQKQRLEEMHLFRKIFSDFNNRYDLMNETLNQIVHKSDSDSLSEIESDTLNDYFNLCGEEYLYHRAGYLLPGVWQSWESGIRDFLKCKHFQEHWNREKLNGSYYGLEVRIA